MSNFKAGDVVRHKSNGQRMAVIEVMKNGTVHCSYQDTNNEFKQGFFAVDTLEKVTENNNPQNKHSRLLLIVILISILLILFLILK